MLALRQLPRRPAAQPEITTSRDGVTTVRALSPNPVVVITGPLSVTMPTSAPTKAEIPRNIVMVTVLDRYTPLSPYTALFLGLGR